MGSYAELIVDGYSLLPTKSYVDSTIMTLFRESDKRTVEKKSSLADGEEPSDQSPTATCIGYANTAANIKQRLNVMGFSLRCVEQDFRTAMSGVLEELGEWAKDSPYAESHLEDKRFLERLSLKDFICAFEEIRKRGLYDYSFRHLPAQDCSPLIRRILGDDDLFFGFPCSDIRFFLRAFLETCPDNTLVEEDITDLVSSGYYDPDETVCTNALCGLTASYPADEKIIVLTEGAFDRSVLEDSLRLLYPHLWEYYSFMDFGTANAEGGVGFLVSTIKAFAGSGISNRVVALFDNDTAAHEAVRGLTKTSVPPNIKILMYPPVPIAVQYPTLGPSGASEADINGSACSIELYLGRDVLTRDGKLIPVQWKGYSSGTGGYQGEIQDKKYIHDAFSKQLRDCREDASLVGRTDWSGIRAILEAMFGVFQ